MYLMDVGIGNKLAL